MSCDYCKAGHTLCGSDGSFRVGYRTVRHMNGSKSSEPIIKYCAWDSVFATDIEIEDHVVINYCPMCGEKLGEDGGE